LPEGPVSAAERHLPAAPLKIIQVRVMVVLLVVISSTLRVHVCLFEAKGGGGGWRGGGVAHRDE